MATELGCFLLEVKGHDPHVLECENLLLQEGNSSLLRFHKLRHGWHIFAIWFIFIFSLVEVLMDFLSFSSSSLIVRILCDAHEKEEIKFRVIVVDSRPKQEGKEAAKRLIRCGVKCSYVLINSVFYMMPEVIITSQCSYVLVNSVFYMMPR